MERSKFAGGDVDYLREVQYGKPAKLQARMRLHAKYSTAESPWFDWLVTRVDWPAGAEVLEVGCGTGAMWVEAAEVLPSELRLTLTDLSPGMVTEATEAVAALGRFTSVEGREADAQALPFDDGVFDIVVANHMLFHLPDPAVGVAEIARVLRGEGALLASTLGPSHLMELNEITRSVFEMPRSLGVADTFGSQSGGPLLEGHFQQVHWHPFPDRLRCTNEADVLAFVTSTPPAEDASPGELEVLRREVHARFEQGGGVLEVTKDVGAFVARGPRRSIPNG